MHAALPFEWPYSHPPTDQSDPTTGTLVVAHGATVSERAVQNISRGPSSERLRRIARVAGFCHDFGKLTRFFQSYLAGAPPANDRLRYHAPLGALATYHDLRAAGASERDALVGFVAVAKHHGRLPDVAAHVVTTALDTARADLIDEQLASIDAHPLLCASADTLLTHSSWEAFQEAWNDGDLEAELTARLTHPGPLDDIDVHALDEAFYDDVVRVWGALITADKVSAAGLGGEATNGARQSPETVETYITEELGGDASTERGRRLNALRDDARRDALEAARTVPLGSVTRLTLPTGLGKTLTGLQVAHTMLDRYDNPGRVIYAIPFTSVIEQTADVVQTVFDLDPHGDALTIHDHLHETVTTREGFDDDRTHSRAAYLLGETWLAGLVLTTYVQLFESLAKPRNAQALKLPALANSVIVLDEPQSLPTPWWAVVQRVVRTLTESYGATVISMTATPPKLFEGGTPLVEDTERYFGAAQRVEYAIHESVRREDVTLSVADGAATMVESLSDEDPTALAVCNTVASAEAMTTAVDSKLRAAGYEPHSLGRLYDQRLTTTGERPSVSDLVEAFDAATADDDDSVATVHLSTRLRSTDRSVILQAMTALADRADGRVCAVSTQLVEAGVDVSFARVYRDLAPLSSIVQAAGRCNREFERDRGTVTVWQLAAPEGGSPPSIQIYARGDHNRIRPTTDVIRTVLDDGETTVPEVKLAHDGIEDYYDRLADRGIPTTYAEYIDTAQFAHLHDLAYIEEFPFAVDVLVVRTPADCEHVMAIRSRLADEAYRAAKRRLTQVAPLRVSVPVRGEERARLLGLPTLDPSTTDEEGESLRVLDVREWPDLFDPVRGVSPATSGDATY